MKLVTMGSVALFGWVLAGSASAQFATAVPAPGGALQKGVPSAFVGGALPSGTQALLVGGGNDCAVPDVISGQGSVPFDLTAATQGSNGQLETLCFSGGSSLISADVWFSWTADATGSAIITTCGGTTVDTRIAAYPGTPTCPTTGSALACSDDACGDQSTIVFPVTNGSTYMIQVGTFPGAPTGTGVVNFTIATTAPANDNCNNPIVIAGSGPHAFDNVVATTGTQGQGEAACLAFATTGIANDVWFTWTAPSTGGFVVTTCAQAQSDTKIAVHDGAGCPTPGSAIGCNDNACATQTKTEFQAVQGNTYTIQVGNRPGTVGGLGSFSIDPLPAQSCYTLDFGAADNAIGLNLGGDLIILNGYMAGGGADVLTEIHVTHGFAGTPGGWANPGPMIAAIWNDPTNDFNPSDAVLLHQQTVNPDPLAIDTDVFQVISVPNIPVTGVFFVGIMYDNHPAAQFPASLDQDLPSGNFSWVTGGATGDLANLAANAIAPQTLDSLSFFGRWMIRAVGPNCNSTGLVGTGYCFGDGSGTVGCPCGNNGSAGRGCANSMPSGGALLEGEGTTSVSAANLVLKGSGAQPGQPGLYFQGNNAINGGNGIQNGDGLRCAGGSIRRLQVRTASGAASPNPGSSETTIDIGAAGAVSPGDTRRYQWWYRNPAPGAPCGTTFNLSNGLEITWTP